MNGHALARPRAPRRLAPSKAATGVSPPFAVSVGLALLFSYLASDWIAGAGILLLWVVWRWLYEPGEAPVLPMALSFQWLQVTCGIYYLALTGREVEAVYASDYRPMVLIGLGCVTALFVGIVCGLRLAPSFLRRGREQKRFAFTWRTLFVAYVASIFLSMALRAVAWSVPMLTQGLLALGYLRLALLYLIFRRLSQPRMRGNWFAAILMAELLLGFTGYFAGFREPLVLAVLALVECFDHRSATHWLRLAAFAGIGILLGAVWIGIRTTYRQQYHETRTRAERLESVGSLSSSWFQSGTANIFDDVDQLVDRLWTIYYPALAVSRVPEVLPHTEGALLLSALKHIVTPRILFPDKGVLPSDSELVRKYTGIHVAGAEQNTSIAFGYAAEAYVDFGIPVMFVPSLVFGIVMGVLYRYLSGLLRHRELTVGFVTVVFWLSLYLFERSWIKTLGLTLTLVVYLGALVWLLDRYLWMEAAKRSRAATRRTAPTRATASLPPSLPR